MTVKGDYMGMALSIDDLDGENLAYFKHCAEHAFHLQKCDDCKMLRYPPTTACPFCASANATWTAVEGKGAVYSYLEVHHAIQPAFKAKTPYMVLLVELDTQQGAPTPDDALRVAANLTTLSGELASPETVRSVGIGTRVRMVFSDVSDGLALPQWTIDETAKQPDKPWRYPQE
jgi:uncharacterized OB-fold protein